nr:hypothetical protein [Neorhizobium tomejilense]
MPTSSPTTKGMTLVAEDAADGSARYVSEVANGGVMPLDYCKDENTLARRALEDARALSA